MCDWALFFFVIVIVFVNTETRPAKIIKRDINDNGLDTSDSDQLMYKLPVMITEGVVVTIKGILNSNHKTFIALLPSSSGEDNCKIIYNFEKNTLEIMPASSSDYEPSNYKLEMDPTGTNTFTLKLKARIANETPIFDFTFEGNEHLKTGPSDIVTCKIKSFEDISYIVMKEGVQSVRSLLFEFPE